MKIKKSTVFIIFLVLCNIYLIGGVAKEKYNDFIGKKVTEGYDQCSSEYIDYLFVNAVSCERISVKQNNVTRTLIAIECLNVVE